MIVFFMYSFFGLLIQGCAASVESWLLTNLGVVLGICLGVALIEVHCHGLSIQLH